MTKSLNILQAVWLALALVLTPLPVFSVQADSQDQAPCPSHADAGAAADIAESPAPPCRHCGDHPCDGDDCSAHGCNQVHQQPGSVENPGLKPQMLRASSDSLASGPLHSRTDPPLLRPPL